MDERSRPRVPRGVRTGGRFTAGQHGEPSHLRLVHDIEGVDALIGDVRREIDEIERRVRIGRASIDRRWAARPPLLTHPRENHDLQAELDAEERALAQDDLRLAALRERLDALRNRYPWGGAETVRLGTGGERPVTPGPGGPHGFFVAPDGSALVVQVARRDADGQWHATPATFLADTLVQDPPRGSLVVDLGSGWELSEDETAALVQYARDATEGGVRW